MDSKVRWEMQLRRGGIGYAQCDNGCGKPGTDAHHLINRGSIHSEAGRAASERIELLSWVCQDCHIGSRNVHNPEARERLLRRNVELFGYDNVVNALQGVAGFLSHPVTLGEEDGTNGRTEE